MKHDEEIKKYEEEAERLKAAYLQVVGVISYLKKQKEEEGKKKEDK